MKRLLLFCLVAVVFYACQSSSPKETAQSFIKAVYTSDLTTASGLVSSDTKAVLDKAKKETDQTQTPEEAFQLEALTENINGEKADVKNDIVALSLVKEDGWKVVLNEKLLHDIQDRDERLSGVKTKWETLLKEYEARLNILKEYIRYKKRAGPLSPKMEALEKEVNSFPMDSTWTGGKLQAYTQKQQQLNKLIEDAHEPSATNADLSLNYFVQISNSGDRIKAAEADYQPLAENVHSPVYVPLPFKTSNTAQNAR